MKKLSSGVCDQACLKPACSASEAGSLISSHLSPLTLEVVGAHQMTLQQYLSILLCLSLPSGNLQTPFPPIPWCYLPISSSVFLSFLLLKLDSFDLASTCILLSIQRTTKALISLHKQGFSWWLMSKYPWPRDINVVMVDQHVIAMEAFRVMYCRRPL